MSHLMWDTGADNSLICIAPVGRLARLPVAVLPRLFRREPNPNIH
jgi:hypothetical protein